MSAFELPDWVHDLTDQELRRAAEQAYRAQMQAHSAGADRHPQAASLFTRAGEHMLVLMDTSRSDSVRAEAARRATANFNAARTRARSR